MTKYFIRPKEAADMLQVSTRTLGVIRYPLDNLERYINKNLHNNARAKNK